MEPAFIIRHYAGKVKYSVKVCVQEFFFYITGRLVVLFICVTEVCISDTERESVCACLCLSACLCVCKRIWLFERKQNAQTTSTDLILLSNLIG